MQARDVAMRLVFVGTALTAAALIVPPAAASTTHKKAAHDAAATTKVAAKSAVHLGGGEKAGVSAHLSNGVYYRPASRSGSSKTGKMRFASRSDSGYSYGGSLQCVPFARAASGIELKGNAAEWWYAAA